MEMVKIVKEPLATLYHQYYLDFYKDVIKTLNTCYRQELDLQGGIETVVSRHVANMRPFKELSLSSKEYFRERAKKTLEAVRSTEHMVEGFKIGEYVSLQLENGSVTLPPQLLTRLYNKWLENQTLGYYYDNCLKCGKHTKLVNGLCGCV